MSRIVVEMTSEEAKLHAGMMRVVQDHVAHEAAVTKTAKATREAAREEEKLAREAKRVYEDTRSPMQAHADRLQRLAQLRQKDLITEETYGRAASASYARMEKAMGRSNAEARRMSEVLAWADRQSKTTFGPAAIGRVASFAAQVIGITTAAGAAIAALNKLDSWRSESAEAGRNSAMSFSQLSQLALKETPDGMVVDRKRAAELRGKARTMFALGGGSTQEEANALLFAVVSGSMEADAEKFARLRASGQVTDPKRLVESVAALQAAFGERATGDVGAILTKGLIASQNAPALTEELLIAAAGTAKYAPAIGVSDVEALSAVAATSKPMAGAAKAGTAITRLLASLGKIGAGALGDVEGENGTDVEQTGAEAESLKAKIRGRLDFRGRSLIERLHQIKSLGLDEEELQKLFGRQEAVAGYRFLLAQESVYGRTVANMQRTRRDLTYDLTAAAMDDPEVAAALQATRQKAAETQAQTSRYGAGTNVWEAAYSYERKRYLKSGMSDLAIVKEDTTHAIGGRFGERYRKWYLRTGLEAGQYDEAPELKRLIENYVGVAADESTAPGTKPSAAQSASADKLDAAADKLNQAADRLSAPRPTLAPPNARN